MKPTTVNSNKKLLNFDNAKLPLGFCAVEYDTVLLQPGQLVGCFFATEDEGDSDSSDDETASTCPGVWSIGRLVEKSPSLKGAWNVHYPPEPEHIRFALKAVKSSYGRFNGWVFVDDDIDGISMSIDEGNVVPIGDTEKDQDEAFDMLELYEGWASSRGSVKKDALDQVAHPSLYLYLYHPYTS